MSRSQPIPSRLKVCWSACDATNWGSKTFVQSTCDDWLDYPRLTGKKRAVNCDDWGSGGIRAHHKWWLHHLPKSPGSAPDGKLANWWAYVSDFNSYPESNGRWK